MGPCLLRSTLLERGETQWPLINAQIEKENVLRIRKESKILRMVVTHIHAVVPPGPPNQLQEKGGRISSLPLVCQCLTSYNDCLLNSYPGGGRKTVLPFRPEKKQALKDERGAKGRREPHQRSEPQQNPETCPLTTRGSPDRDGPVSLFSVKCQEAENTTSHGLWASGTESSTANSCFLCN